MVVLLINTRLKMIDKLYKRIVRFLIDHHIAIIDFGSENEVDEFYGWLNSDKSQKQKSSLRKKVIKICAIDRKSVV